MHAIADADCASPPAIAFEAHGSQDCVCGRDGCESTEGSHSLDLYRPLSGDNPLPPASLTPLGKLYNALPGARRRPRPRSPPPTTPSPSPAALPPSPHVSPPMSPPPQPASLSPTTTGTALALLLALLLAARARHRCPFPWGRGGGGREVCAAAAS